MPLIPGIIHDCIFFGIANIAGPHHLVVDTGVEENIRNSKGLIRLSADSDSWLVMLDDKVQAAGRC
jgi:hypothetical protein